MGHRSQDTSRQNRGRHWRRENHIAKDLRTPKFRERTKDTPRKMREELRKEDLNETLYETLSRGYE